LEVLCGYYDSFFLREDDFELCVSEESIVQLIQERGITERLVIVGYGLGLIYIPKSKCYILQDLWWSCGSTADDCLNRLVPYNTPIHFDIPLAVHRSYKQKVQLHPSPCDLMCFIKCKDTGNYENEEISIQDWLQTRNIGYTIPNSTLRCNPMEGLNNPEYCLQYPNNTKDSKK